ERQLYGCLVENRGVYKGYVGLLPCKKFSNGQDLYFRIFAVWGFVVTRLDRFGVHGFRGLCQGDENTYFAFSRSTTCARSRIIRTPTLSPPLTETMAFSVV